jgi:hypothetical protein
MSFLDVCLKTINSLKFSKIRNIKNIIIDSIDLKLNLKNHGKYFSKILKKSKFLKNHDYKRL